MLVGNHTFIAGAWLDRNRARTALANLGLASVAPVPGFVFPGVRDHHVHLGLVEWHQLRDSPVVAVDDLGWGVAEIHSIAASLPTVDVRFAGPFLCAPNGYPCERPWAPAHCVHPITSAGMARDVVDDLATAGVSTIKVSLNSTMATLPAPTLAAIVSQSDQHGLHVTAHVEGPGQTAVALAAGITRLAHTPWTERLSDAETRAVASQMTVISTLAIHTTPDDADNASTPPSPELETAISNLRSILHHGGRVVYGTDMGNGPQPVGLNPSEIRLLSACGLRGNDLLQAMAAPYSPTRAPRVAPTPPPDDPAAFITWLNTSITSQSASTGT